MVDESTSGHPLLVTQNAGEQSAVLDPATVADEYTARVHRFAAMAARTDADAADLAQEALVRALRKLSSYDPRRATLDAWLWRIVVNTARDAGRATRRRHRLWERLAADLRVGEQRSPEDIAIAASPTMSSSALCGGCRDAIGP